MGDIIINGRLIIKWIDIFLDLCRFDDWAQRGPLPSAFIAELHIDLSLASSGLCYGKEIWIICALWGLVALEETH
jgi:hypothetical protein